MAGLEDANPEKSVHKEIRTVNIICIFTTALSFSSPFFPPGFLFCCIPGLSPPPTHWQTERSISCFPLMLSFVIPLCLSRVSIRDSLCFCTPARPCSLTSGPSSVSYEIPVSWPLTSQLNPFPNTSSDNKHEYQGGSSLKTACVSMCLLHACTLSRFCLCSASCNPTHILCMNLGEVKEKNHSRLK